MIHSSYSMRGLSMSGFIMSLFLFCICALIAMKLIPEYIEFHSVKASMNSMKTIKYNTLQDVKLSLAKKFDINYVTSVHNDDITISRDNGAYDVSVDYYIDKTLLGNQKISGHFQYSITTAN